MQLQIKSEAELERTGPTDEHLSVNFNYRIDGLLDTSIGETPQEALGRSEARIFQEIASFVAEEVVPDMVKGLARLPSLPPVRPGLQTQWSIKSSGRDAVENSGQFTHGTIDMDIKLSSNRPAGFGESVLNSRVGIANSFTQTVMTSLKRVVLGHERIESNAESSILASQAGLKINKYVDITRGSGSQAEL